MLLATLFRETLYDNGSKPRSHEDQAREAMVLGVDYFEPARSVNGNPMTLAMAYTSMEPTQVGRPRRWLDTAHQHGSRRQNQPQFFRACSNRGALKGDEPTARWKDAQCPEFVRHAVQPEHAIRVRRRRVGLPMDT
jgi:hypothetical protein